MEHNVGALKLLVKAAREGRWAGWRQGRPIMVATLLAWPAGRGRGRRVLVWHGVTSPDLGHGTLDALETADVRRRLSEADALNVGV